ncbi:unnamed protein product (macronuclear) [Paramecium tetraurelia]|uniref:Uncharacterized protein n=1 Tax=Paramecium tetraurelia TaxID=5888 RepID=A0BCS6_PARTE|nr:uncharacterized protein GSPATT00004437001 [Paramecium tetraurelia]CAK56343.1 unnamed protein product [Paramecium tetraurelia]|eukprot:XP_001423741.1 hypothetical protein (macronuclear) [Paramecium tetraurelia strain d4-2]
MYLRERRATSYQKPQVGQDDLRNQLNLLDQFVRPTYDVKLPHDPSQKSGIRQSNHLNKSFQLPKLSTLPEESINEEVAQMQQAIDQQNQTLKRLLKEQREVNKAQLFKQELENLKTQVQTIHLKLPKLPQYEQLNEIKHEISSLRQSFFQQAQQPQQPIIQPPQIIYQQMPQPLQQPQYYPPPYPYYPPPYPPYGQPPPPPYGQQPPPYPPQQQLYQPPYQYNPYQYPYQPQPQPQEGQQNQQNPQSAGKIKTKTAGSQGQNSRRSSQNMIPLVSKRSIQQTKQSFFSDKGDKRVPFQGSRLKVIFNAVRFAMRWKIYCKPLNILWRKLYKHSVECKAVIQKISYHVALKRINDWCKMVLAKVENYLSKIKEIDFINPEKPLTEQEIDQSYMQLTNVMKYLMTSLVTYCTNDFMIPELKFLSYLQFFDQPEIDRGLFVARRVLFWKEKQLDMTKTQQMMIVGDLVILVHILPALLEIPGQIFLVKCMVSLVQIHFMKYFDLRVLNRNPEYRIIQLNLVDVVDGKLVARLEKLEKFDDERYIVGVYEESQFQGFYAKRPHFQDDMQKALFQIHTNLLQALAAK